MYTTLRTMSLAGNGERGVRIMTMHPTTPWDNVWKNLFGQRWTYNQHGFRLSMTLSQQMND
jgi:hypothetical protein